VSSKAWRWGLLLDYSIHTQLWIQTHVCTHPKMCLCLHTDTDYRTLFFCFFLLLYFFFFIKLFIRTLLSTTWTYTHQWTHLTQTLGVHYCGSGWAEECHGVKTKAEQNSTGDCINTQAFCSTWRDPPPSSLFTPSPKRTFTVAFHVALCVHMCECSHLQKR